MKNIRIVHGTLMYPLEVGSRALIFEEGRYLHTSTVIAIHGVTPRQIRFETMNSHYCLLAPSSPVAADVSWSRRRNILVERHSTIVVLCLSAISTEEVEKCMRWSFVPQAGITSGYAARSVKRKLRLSACVKVSRI